MGSSPIQVAIFFYLVTYGQIAQSVEQGTENPRVGSSILSLATNYNGCGSSSVDRAPPCQGGGREFESRLPLHKNILGIVSVVQRNAPIMRV